jgi:hypothetical protein
MMMSGETRKGVGGGFYSTGDVRHLSRMVPNETLNPELHVRWRSQGWHHRPVSCTTSPSGDMDARE